MNGKKLLIAVGLVCHAAMVLGQCCPGHLYGTVTDPTGAPIANATVTIHSCQQKSEKDETGSTKSDGTYYLQGRWGFCDVTFVAQGFAALERPHIQVEIDQNLKLDAQLRLGERGDPPTVAPTADSTNPIAREATPWDLGVLAQGGFGVTEDRGGFRFFMAGVHAGKVLTGNAGPGWLRGNFEYAVEVFPLWQSYTPTMQRQNCVPIAGSAAYDCSAPFTVGGTFSGASITPIILRWNLVGTPHFAPWVQGAGGVVWTDHKYPAFGGLPVNLGGITSSGIGDNGPNDDTSVWNFTPQFGVGVHYFVAARRSIDFGANAIHISSASLGDKNPGINASVQFTVGYSWWK